MGNDSEVQVKFSAEIKGLLEGLKQAQEHTESATMGMKGDLGSMISSLDHLGTAAIGLGAVGLAFETIKESVEWAEEAIESTNKLSRAFEDLHFQTGESFESLNVLKTSMLMTGGTVQELGGWMKGASRAMSSNTEVLLANGVAADRAALMAMPFAEYLRVVMEKALAIHEPFRRATFLTESLGRAGVEAGPQIKEMLESLEEAQGVFDKYGNAIDKKAIERTQEFERELGKLQTIHDSVMKSISDHSMELVLGWKGAKTSFLQLVDAIVGGKSTLADVFAGKTSSVPMEQVWTSRGFRKKDEGGLAVPDKGQGDTDENLMQQTKDGWVNVAKAIAEAKAAASKKAAEGGKDLTKAELEEITKVAEKEASVQKAIQTERNRFAQTQNAQALAEDLRGLEERRKATEEFTRIQAAADKERSQMARLASADRLDESLAALEAQQTMLDQQVALGVMSVDAEVAQRKRLLAIETQMEIQALQRELQLEDLSMARRAEVSNKILALKRKETSEIQKLDNQVELNWKTRMDKVTTNWDVGIQQILHGQMSLTQGVRGAMSQVEDQVEKSLINMGLQWGKYFLIQELTSKKAHMSQNMLDAKDAAAGAYKATVGIPYIGPILAPAAAAVAFGATMAFAEGGWDQVPADQVAMIHKNEMVLSAPIAEGARRVFAAAAAGGGGEGQGGGESHLHVHTMDASSFHTFLKQPANIAAVRRVLGGAARDRRII